MSTVALEQLTPLHVSELPPVPAPVHAHQDVVSRLRNHRARRRFERAFDRAVSKAAPGEYGDLLAAARRD